MRPRKKLNQQEIAQLTNDLHNHSVNVYTREIYIHGYYGVGIDSEESEIDFKVAATFLKNLHLLDQLGRAAITIHMNILGGSWCDGIAMINAIRASHSNITIINYSAASSMSGVLLQAADKRVMMPYSHFMMHHGGVGLEYTASKAASEAIKFNDYECNVMLDIFAERAVNGPYFLEREWDVKQIKKFFINKLQAKTDWYLTAEKSILFGLADSILKN